MFYIYHHMERTHVIFLPQNRRVDVGGGVRDIYRVSFLWVLKSVVCPVYQCPAREINPGRLREHFMYRHWKSKVDIIQKVPEPIPRCDYCGMHMPAAQLVKHIRTERCNKSTEMRIRRRGF